MRGGQPFGMSLTGGLDGRMIMAWLRQAPGTLPCYTFNGPIRDCADVRIAREVARTCGQPFQTIPLADGFFTDFPKLAAQSIRVSDGAMDVTGAAELYLNRRARVIAPVRLTGNYGSEVVRGNVAFRPRRISRELFSADCCAAADRATQTYGREAAGRRLSFIAFKQVPWHHFARFAVERSELTPRSPFLDSELMAWLFRAPSESANALEPSLRLIAEGDPRLGRIPTDRGVTYPAGQWSNRVNRQVQEFLARAEYAYDYGMPDWLARVDHCFAPLRLERLFLGRQKFCHFRSWYRRELAGFVREVLLDPAARSRSYLNGDAVESLVTAHIRGTRNATTAIHKLLSLELIHRELIA
jgi:asparagine synthase (glutamine-hydrolysing)